MTRLLEERLKEPFPATDIQWRVSRSGWKQDGNPWVMALAYVDARADMDRLDEVFGVDGWYDDYEFLPSGVLCRLTVKFSENNCVTKVDGSPETQVEGFKGGISKALVRCSAKYGIGRYLYNLKSNFAECTAQQPKNKDSWTKVWDKKEQKNYWWRAPSLPLWALPKTPYVIDFKPHIGKKLEDFSDDFLEAYVDELEASAHEIGKEIRKDGPVGTFIKEVEKHLGV